MKIIKTNRLVLKGLTIKDAKDMYLYAKEPLVGYNAGWTPHKDLKETIEIIKKMIKQNNVYGLFYDDKLIGTIDITLNKGKYYLGYALGKDFWGKGLMSEAAVAILLDFFSENKDRNLYARTFYYNLRSQNLLKKLGFNFKKEMKINVFNEDINSYLYKLEYNKFKGE